MAKLIFASKNEGKVREFREFLTPLGVEVVSLNELENVPTMASTQRVTLAIMTMRQTMRSCYVNWQM